jgi:hypothetical protein
VHGAIRQRGARRPAAGASAVLHGGDPQGVRDRRRVQPQARY